jgi:hypothetical protein
LIVCQEFARLFIKEGGDESTVTNGAGEIFDVMVHQVNLLWAPDLFGYAASALNSHLRLAVMRPSLQVRRRLSPIRVAPSFV